MFCIWSGKKQWLFITIFPMAAFFAGSYWLFSICGSKSGCFLSRISPCSKFCGGVNFPRPIICVDLPHLNRKQRLADPQCGNRTEMLNKTAALNRIAQKYRWKISMKFLGFGKGRLLPQFAIWKNMKYLQPFLEKKIMDFWWFLKISNDYGMINPRHLPVKGFWISNTGSKPKSGDQMVCIPAPSR